MTRRCAIFNGFPFHFEVFGAFIQYCWKRGYELSIFTSKCNEQGWFDFYKSCFSEYRFQIRDICDFSESEFSSHDYIFLTTDDDPHFSNQYMSLADAHQKVIAYDHYYQNRRTVVSKHVGIRPFLRSRPDMRTIYPVYEMISKHEKETLLGTQISVVIIGCPVNNPQFLTYIDLSNIHITYIRRSISSELRTKFQEVCPSINFVENCTTQQMSESIKNAHYLFILVDDENYTHFATSGAIGLAFSAGCQIVMPRGNNIEYNFTSALYFEDRPLLEKPDLDAVFKEREEILLQNYRNLDDILS